jgi:hypothetical protein
MNYKAMVPAPISRAIHDFGIGRELLVRLLTAIHVDVPGEYLLCRRFRMEKDDRFYRYRIILDDERLRHAFRMAVDDTTAPGFLIVVSIRHETRPFPPKS